MTEPLMVESSVSSAPPPQIRTLPSTTTLVRVQVSPAGTTSRPTVVSDIAPVHGVAVASSAGPTDTPAVANATATPTKNPRTCVPFVCRRTAPQETEDVLNIRQSRG